MCYLYLTKFILMADEEKNQYDDLINNFRNNYADELPLIDLKDQAVINLRNNFENIDSDNYIPLIEEVNTRGESEQDIDSLCNGSFINSFRENNTTQDSFKENNQTWHSEASNVSRKPLNEKIINYSNEDIEDNIIDEQELEEIKSDLNIGKATIDDFQTLFSINTDEEGNIVYTSIRNAEFKANKVYLDDHTKEPRLKILNNGFKVFLNSDEKLGDIIDILPYGLIDKKITGIGATTLELKSQRNSIIVMPTKALAYDKYNSLENKEDVLLCIGTGYLDLIEPISELKIRNYIKRKDIPYYKIIIIADSIEKVVSALLKYDKNVYTNYFFMVDEIDSLQSNNKLRKRISNVIDYYFKFKVQMRALVSATINEFSHPLLKEEPLTIFDYKTPKKRDITLIYTKNTNVILAEKIISIADNSQEKIVIAYNSILNILHTIRLLPEELQAQCNILCSDTNKTEVEEYYTLLNDGRLERRITFMTSSYFSGIDIYDTCHLISVSNTNKLFSILSLNIITQIYGRFRNGIISDTIIYNILKLEDEHIDIAKYRDKLIYKAERVIDLLKMIETTVNSEDKYNHMDINDLNVLFGRIMHLVLENADERLLNRDSYPLARRNINNEIEISYFNIDDLCHKMLTYKELYSDIKNLYNILSENHNVQAKCLKYEIKQEKIRDTKREILTHKQTYIRDRLSNAQQTVIRLFKNNLLEDRELAFNIKEVKTQYEKEFYTRVKKYYLYIDIHSLTDNLIDISLGNKKNYRNLKNTFAFWLLEKKHPFKSQVLKAFKTGERYSSKEIEEILSPIINYHFFKIISRSRLVNHFKSYFKCTYTGGKYLIKNDNPLGLPKPLKTISANEVNLKDYFEI